MAYTEDLQESINLIDTGLTVTFKDYYDKLTGTNITPQPTISEDGTRGVYEFTNLAADLPVKWVLNNITLADGRVLQVSGTSRKFQVTVAEKDEIGPEIIADGVASEANATTNTTSIITEIDANETKIDSIQADLNNGTDGLGALKILIDAVQADLDNGTDGLGALKTLIDAIQTDLDNGTDGLGALKALIDAVQTDLDNGTDGLGALKTAIDGNATPAEVATELTNLGLDHLLAAAVVGADITDDSIIAQMTSKSATADFDSFDNTSDSLEAISDSAAAAALTQQNVRDSMKLTPTAGSPSAGSVDLHLDDIEADTNETQGKLPTNNIMGSSVKTDKDDEIDSIKSTVDTNLDTTVSSRASETNATNNTNNILATTQTTTGTAQSGAATTITLAVGESAVNDTLKNQVITIVSGTGADQTRIITGYNGTTKVATVHEAWATNPDGTSVYTIGGLSAALIQILSDETAFQGADIAPILADTNEMQGKLPTNNIMGSSVKTDKDDEIDSIKSTVDTNLDATVSSRATPAQVNTEVDTALADIGLDHLISASVAGADVADDSIIAKLVSKAATADFDTFVNTTDSLEAIADGVATGLPAAVADAVLKELVTDHVGVTDSLADFIRRIAGLMQENFFLDNTTHNANGFLTAGRIRLFGNNSFTATDGGTGEGEIATYNIVSVTETGKPTQTKTYQVKKV